MMNLNESSAPMPSPFPVGDPVIVVVSSTASGRIACYHKQPKTWKRKTDAHDAPSKKKQKKDAAEPETEEADKESEKKKNKKKKKNDDKMEIKETKPEAEEKPVEVEEVKAV